MGKPSARIRDLPVWILIAMAIGLLLRRVFGGLAETVDTIKIDTVSQPIAIGLLAIMHSVPARVKYSKIGEVTADRRLMATSLLTTSVSISLGLFSPVSALSDLNPSRRVHHVRNGCVRNPHAPVVSSDQHACCHERCATRSSRVAPPLGAAMRGR